VSALASSPAATRAKEKDLGFAYLWWFLLGLCGAHKFYLGKVGWGFLYFFTGGLFFVGWLIDLFTLPDQVRRHNEAVRGMGEVRATTGAAPDPWPRRIFLLIVLLVVVPIVLFAIGLIVPILSKTQAPKPAAAAEHAASLVTPPPSSVNSDAREVPPSTPSLEK
jgi:hypothetical protein